MKSYRCATCNRMVKVETKKSRRSCGACQRKGQRVERYLEQATPDILARAVAEETLPAYLKSPSKRMWG
ncbi:MAG: hypothetical protein KC492_13625 [Myxococcales bacterium]|nr:hypothetical protein [Myxococcales bacterium]